MQYSLICAPDGGIVDDATVYRLGPDHYMVTVNAGNIDKDWAWVGEQGAATGARWRNVSADTGLIAVQGPKAEALVARLADLDVRGIAYYHAVRGRVAGVPTLVSRTGYTGEDGFELFCAAADAPRAASSITNSPALNWQFHMCAFSSGDKPNSFAGWYCSDAASHRYKAARSTPTRIGMAIVGSQSTETVLASLAMRPHVWASSKLRVEVALDSGRSRPI